MSTDNQAATNIATAATKTATDFSLTPPDPVPAVAPAQAAGLVPVSSEEKTKLDNKVDAFVADLVSQDANSPAFGEKVDQITRMGQEQIRAAAGQSNRFLDRPVRAMDSDSAAQFGQILAHAVIAVHRAHGAIEEAVGMAGGRADLFLTHARNLVDFLT
ncbi:MAG: hypothetical protein AAFR88_03200, partial [Pseudomonadota bacterium]